MAYLLKMVIFHGLPIKNGDFSMVYLLKMVIFHGLPIKNGDFPWFTY